MKKLILLVLLASSLLYAKSLTELLAANPMPGQAKPIPTGQALIKDFFVCFGELDMMDDHPKMSPKCIRLQKPIQKLSQDVASKLKKMGRKKLRKLKKICKNNIADYGWYEGKPDSMLQDAFVAFGGEKPDLAFKCFLLLMK